MQNISRPNVKSYLDVRVYLQELYRFLKNQKNEFSYEIWAKELGIERRSYLRLAIIGKRKISDLLIQKLSDWLDLKESDREYFFILAQFSQSNIKQQKQILGKKLTTILRTHSNFSELQPDLELLESPVVMIIRNILSFSDIPRSVEYIARLVNLSPEVTEKILFKLSQLNQVQQNENQWYAIHENVKIPSIANNQSIRLYHKMSLQKAVEAQALPVSERFYKSISLALSEENYLSFIHDVDAFAREVFDKYNSSELIGKRVYQTNFNAIPWTNKAELDSI